MADTHSEYTQAGRRSLVRFISWRLWSVDPPLSITLRCTATGNYRVYSQTSVSCSCGSSRTRESGHTPLHPCLAVTGVAWHRPSYECDHSAAGRVKALSAEAIAAAVRRQVSDNALKPSDSALSLTLSSVKVRPPDLTQFDRLLSRAPRKGDPDGCRNHVTVVEGQSEAT